MKATNCAWIMAVMSVVGPGRLAVAQESSPNVPVGSNSPAFTVPLPPLPPGLPPSQAHVTVLRTEVTPPSTPAAPPPIPAPPAQLPAGIIAWDADTKEYATKPGELSAPFTFYFTNVSAGEVVLKSVGTSCGCTVAQLPPLPWTLPAGTNSSVPVTINVAGKSGIVLKTVTIRTDKGDKTLTLKVAISPPSLPKSDAMNRQRNQEIAKTDRQAVFKGDCARCHVEPCKGKLGRELYAAACGICHEAEHRATMVADLHALTQDTNPEYWKTWIARGKPGTLMPAFAQSEGGPLSEGQINSLVEYLVTAIPPRGAAHAGQPTVAN